MLTITEGLAEIKTLTKRISKKREAISQYLARQEALKDPLANDGGSVEFIQREQQAVRDLEDRHIAIRRAIALANAETELKINGASRSIADWLTWRREVAPHRQQHLGELRRRIETLRREAQQKGLNVVSAVSAVSHSGESRPSDVLVNISEKALAEETEALEATLGELDGLLSLKNATTAIRV